MRSRGRGAVLESEAGPNEERRALAAAILQPLRDLNAAAEEAMQGRLGGAKLGVLVAATRIVKVLQAIDAEFERQRCASKGAWTDGPDSSRERV